jgi:hypothetical protein
VIGAIARRVGMMARGPWLTANDPQMRLDARTPVVSLPTNTCVHVPGGVKLGTRRRCWRH